MGIASELVSVSKETLSNSFGCNRPLLEHSYGLGLSLYGSTVRTL